MTPLCLWTGQRSDRAIKIEVQGIDRKGRPEGMGRLFVFPEYEAEVRAYAERVQPYGPFLLFGILA